MAGRRDDAMQNPWMATPPRRRRLRTSVRTLMVIVAILAVGLAGFHRWREERDLTFVSYGVEDLLPPDDPMPTIDAREPPPRDSMRDPEYLVLLAEVDSLLGRHNWFGRGRACARPVVSFQFGRAIDVRDNSMNQATIGELFGRKRPGGPARPPTWVEAWPKMSIRKPSGK